APLTRPQSCVPAGVTTTHKNVRERPRQAPNPAPSPRPGGDLGTPGHPPSRTPAPGPHFDVGNERTPPSASARGKSTAGEWMKQLVWKFIGAVTGERRRTRRGGRRRTDHEPNHGWQPVLALALPIALLDWAVKWAIVQTIPLHQQLVISDRVSLWHVKNPALV